MCVDLLDPPSSLSFALSANPTRRLQLATTFYLEGAEQAKLELTRPIMGPDVALARGVAHLKAHAQIAERGLQDEVGRAVAKVDEGDAILAQLGVDERGLEPAIALGGLTQRDVGRNRRADLGLPRLRRLEHTHQRERVIESGLFGVARRIVGLATAE